MTYRGRYDYSDLIDELDDVEIGTLSDNDLLQFDDATGLWKNETVAEVAGTIDHGLLLGLADDDHTQYLLIDGTRDMTGELVLDGNISAAGSGIDFSAENLTNIGTFSSTGTITWLGASTAVWSDASKEISIFAGGNSVLYSVAGAPYILIDTSVGTENIQFGNVVTNQNYTFVGNGITTLSGTLDVTLTSQFDGKVTIGDGTPNGQLFIAGLASSPPASRGSEISLTRGQGNATTATAFLFVNNANQLVFDTTEQSVGTDTGNIYIDFDTGEINTADNLVFPKASGFGIKIDRSTPTFGFADLLGDQFSRNTGGTKPLLTAYNGDVDAWKFQADDEAFLSYHIPHDYVLGTDIHLHIHWSLNAVATGGTLTFKYTAIYAKGHNQVSGSTFTSTPITATFTTIDINDGGSGLFQYQQHLTEVTISAATATAALFDRDDFEPDGVIELTFELDADNLTGTPSDPFIHFVDIHYQTTGLIGTKAKAPNFYA